MRIVADFLNDNVTYDDSNTILFQKWYLLAPDIIIPKLYKQTPWTLVPKQPYSILKMSFKNKGVELLHLPLILNHSFVNFSIPRKHPNFKVPYVIYKLEK